MAKKTCNISRTYSYAYHDIVAAFNRVAIARYGADCMRGQETGRLFWRGEEPLNIEVFETGLNKKEPLVVGVAVIQKIPAVFNIGANSAVSAYEVPPEARDEVEKFLTAIQVQLETKSIYRGQALIAGGEFLDTSGIVLESMVYNDKVLRDLRAHVWTMITDPDFCKTANVGATRKILFSGPYGSGKTVAAYLTAQLGTKLRWTFFYLPPTEQGNIMSIRAVLASARHYEPSIVFIEDIDREQRERNQFALGAIMTEIDGIASKNARMIILMSTNHLDKVTEGLQRPGRTDKIIDFGVFTASDIERLLRKNIPQLWLAEDIDWEKVAKACKGFSAVFVSEVGKSAMLLSKTYHEGSDPKITTEILLEAANDLQGQHSRSNARFGFSMDSNK